MKTNVACPVCFSPVDTGGVCVACGHTPTIEIVSGTGHPNNGKAFPDWEEIPGRVEEVPEKPLEDTASLLWDLEMLLQDAVDSANSCGDNPEGTVLAQERGKRIRWFILEGIIMK